MEPINSNADPDIVPATEFSEDGILWQPIPKGITVTGSRYALVLDEIKPGELDLPLNCYEVGIGPSSGKAAETYLQGRIDKACLIQSPASRSSLGKEEKIVRKVGYSAEMKEPFAVLLR